MEDALPYLVERACRHWEAQRLLAAHKRDLSPRSPHCCTVAISREAGTRGTAIAHRVGALLGWHVYDHELLEQIAHDMGLRANLLESVDERQKSWLLESVEAFIAAPGQSDWGPLVTESKYVHRLVQTMLALSLHGNCVIVGRGASFVLPAATTLRIRLMAPLPYRIAALAEQLGISERDAAVQVRNLDHERNVFLRDHFQHDPRELHHYDMILNVERFGAETTVELIVDALRRFEKAALNDNRTSP